MSVCGSRNTARETDSSIAIILHCELSDELCSKPRSQLFEDPTVLEVLHFQYYPFFSCLFIGLVMES